VSCGGHFILAPAGNVARVLVLPLLFANNPFAGVGTNEVERRSNRGVLPIDAVESRCDNTDWEWILVRDACGERGGGSKLVDRPLPNFENGVTSHPRGDATLPVLLKLDRGVTIAVIAASVADSAVPDISAGSIFAAACDGVPISEPKLLEVPRLDDCAVLDDG